MMLFFFMAIAFGIILLVAGVVASALATVIAKAILWAVERRAIARRARGLP